MSLLLAAAATIGLGVGAASSTEVIVKIDGKDTVVRVAGAPAGNQQSKVFLQCLVSHRVLRVSSGKVTMLDNSNVAAHLSEFAQSQTTADPCELGKAAYTPPPLPTPQQVAAAPATPAPAPAAEKSAKSKGKVKEPHVSFSTTTAAPLPGPAPAKPAGTAEQPKKASDAMREPVQPPVGMQPQVVQPQPGYQPPAATNTAQTSTVH